MTAAISQTEVIDVEAAREQLDTLLNRAHDNDARILITRAGEPVAALISVHELEWYKRLLLQHDKLFKSILDLRDDFKDVPDDEIEREIAKALAEVRAENRANAEPAADS